MSRNRHSKNRHNQTMNGSRRGGGQRTTQQRSGGTSSQQRSGGASSQITRAEQPMEQSSAESGATPSSMSAMTSSAMDGALKSMESLGTSARGLATSALNSIKQNPVPYALAGAGVVCAGAGITWLLLSSAGGAAASGSSSEQGEGQSSSSGGRMSMPSMKQATKSVRRAGEKATQLAHEAVESGKKLEQSVEDVVREHPLAIGAALLATGAAIGLAIPRTSLEDGWLGRERDHLVSSAQRLAQGAVSKVESIAKQVTKASSNNIAHA